jgi:sigma-B regulation protein RsbU (phosphoserine phosphatase)
MTLEEQMEQSILKMIMGLVQTMSVIMLLAYILTRRKFFTDILEKKLSVRNLALLIGCFGLLSIYGTLAGFNFYGALITVRDLGPALAGFAGGPIAGLGTGLIGGMHRWFIGGPTTSGCSISTVVIGLAAGLVCKARHGRFISVGGAVLFAILAEAAHLTFTLFFVTSADLPIIPWETRLAIIERGAVPMITANALGMGIFIFIVKNLIHEYKVESAKKLIEGELKVARDIQMGIVPKIFPPYPDRSEVALFASIEPAKEVGGDLYDFFFMDDDHLCFTVGDVSGKGVPAALFMTIIMTLVKTKATQGVTSGIILNSVNRVLSSDNPSLMFVTLFLGILNIRTGELEYSNGGHNPPYIIRTDGDIKPLETTNGMMLGVMEDFSYQTKKIVLQKGESLFIYTDGVTEAMNEKEELFSEDRLEKELALLKERSVQKVVDRISEKIRVFSGGMQQTDDITMMILRFYGQ